MVLRERALPLRSRRDGDLEHLGETPDFVGSVREQGTVAGEDGGTTGPKQVERGLLDGRSVVVLRAMNLRGGNQRHRELLLLHVRGKAQMHGARSPAEGRTQGLLPYVGEAICSKRQRAVSGYSLEHIDDVNAFAAGFLERALPEGFCGDLASQYDHGDGVGKGGRDARDEVCGSRAGG